MNNSIFMFMFYVYDIKLLLVIYMERVDLFYLGMVYLFIYINILLIWNILFYRGIEGNFFFEKFVFIFRCMGILCNFFLINFCV